MIDLGPELEIRTARSGGKGGQNVNKVETMVAVRWNVSGSRILSAEQKEMVLHNLGRKITKDGFLIVKSSETRSQLENRSRAVAKVNELVNKALLIRKKRQKTTIPRAVIEKRLENKKRQSDKKQSRNRLDY